MSKTYRDWSADRAYLVHTFAGRLSTTRSTHEGLAAGGRGGPAGRGPGRVRGLRLPAAAEHRRGRRAEAGGLRPGEDRPQGRAARVADVGRVGPRAGGRRDSPTRPSRSDWGLSRPFLSEMPVLTKGLNGRVVVRPQSSAASIRPKPCRHGCYRLRHSRPGTPIIVPAGLHRTSPSPLGVGGADLIPATATQGPRRVRNVSGLEMSTNKDSQLVAASPCYYRLCVSRGGGI